MMLHEVLETIADSEKIIILKNEEVLFTGYKSLYSAEDAEVKRICMGCDITSKKWKENGLMPPIDQSTMAEYEFKDLQLSVYIRIILG